MGVRSLMVSLAIALPLSAWSQANAAPTGSQTPGTGSKTYVQVRLGVVIPQADDLEDYENGLAFDVALGYLVNPNVAIEAAVGRFAVSYEESIYDPDLGVEITGTDSPTAIPLTATLKFGVPVAEDKAFLYGLAGAGLYSVSDTVKLSAPGYQSFTEDDSATAFGFHFGGGAAFSIGQQFTLGAELRYFAAKVELYDVTSNIDSLTLQGALGLRF